MTALDPQDVERFDEWSRELFGGGCTHVLRTLPSRMAQARLYRSSEREIRRRMRWRRLKRWLTSRPVLVALVMTALVMAFAAGRVFAEGGDANWRGWRMHTERRATANPVSNVPGPRIGNHAGEVRSKPSGVEVSQKDTRGSAARSAAVWCCVDRTAHPLDLRYLAPWDSEHARKGAAGIKPGLGFDRASGEIQRAARGRTLAAEGRSRARVAHLKPWGSTAAEARSNAEEPRAGTLSGEAVRFRTNNGVTAGRDRLPEPCPSTFGDDGLPPLPREEFEECREQASAQLQRDAATLKLLAVLALILTSIVVLRWVRRYEAEPEDEGRVTPPRGRW